MKPLKNSKRLFDLVEYLVDDEVGVIHDLNEVPIEVGSPKIFHFSAIASDTRAFSSQKNFKVGGGASTDRYRALAKSIGEAVERYCSAIYQKSDFPLFSYNDAPFTCVNPEEFALYNKKQYEWPGFPFVPFEKDTPTRWVPSFDLWNRTTIHVPASMVFIPYYYSPGEGPICQSISTGLACHTSVYEAAISAICEVIERDAFMITWLSRISPPKILLESLNSDNIKLIQTFEDCGYSVTLFNLTMDVGIPTILAVSRHNSHETPSLVFAASSSLDPEEALLKSLEELEHTRAYCQYILEKKPRINEEEDYDDIADQQSHLNFWCNQSTAKLASFIFASDKYIKFDQIENLKTENPIKDLKILFNKVNGIGSRILLCDLTTSDVGSLGLRVIRAIIPGFHPLFVGHKIRALGGYRLWTIPQQLGYDKVVYGQENPYPHPYP